MSFDLAAWYEPSPITTNQAIERYLGFVEEDIAVEPPARLVAFERDLMAEYPQGEDSPWSVEPAVTDSAVFMSVVWSRANEFVEYARALADRHGLVLVDLQDHEVRHPSSMRFDLTLAMCDGSRTDNPTPEAIAEALRKLSHRNWFAVLERGDTYVQVGLGEPAGVPVNWYALEYREGSADQHFRVEVCVLDTVIAAFTGFARQDAWRARFTWRKVDLG